VAARWAKPVVDAVRAHGLPSGIYLNVNIPRDPEGIRGYRLASMSLVQDEVSRFELIRNEDGVQWYRSRWSPAVKAPRGTDLCALESGWVAIAPLGIDQTDCTALPELQELTFVNPLLVGEPQAASVNGP
jgi:broad specificity polyphosphatase/5'/3'-nucleotidase SurE